MVDISLVDVPKIPVTVIFTAGCNMDCSYCQNAEIIPLDSGRELSISSIVEKVQGNLTNGYCITGGEPTIHKDLPRLLNALREDGAKYINLNTQGTVPSVLEKSLQYLDSIWFDIKTVPERYAEITRVSSNPWPRILKSINLILNSEVAFWPRTTYVGRLMDAKEILEIARLLKQIGYSGDYLVQNFVKSAGTRAADVVDLDEPDISELDSIRDIMPDEIALKLEWR